MLHDPRWEKEPSLSGFALFVASRDPDERYEWDDCTICAYGQYIAATQGRQACLRDFSEGVGYMANALARGTGPGENLDSTLWTFGQLAERILAAV